MYNWRGSDDDAEEEVKDALQKERFLYAMLHYNSNFICFLR